ncbi:MAG: hypothetical protein HC923_11955 [Myxococcales bacterium]|nr:hypothetical protein [Myxococcales bacterium]
MAMALDDALDELATTRVQLAKAERHSDRIFEPSRRHDGEASERHVSVRESQLEPNAGPWLLRARVLKNSPALETFSAYRSMNSSRSANRSVSRSETVSPEASIQPRP